MKRDISLDSLRGLFLVWMMVNHLRGPFFDYTFQTLGFFSSAEGFVLISGVIAGKVYGHIGLNEGIHSVTKRTLRRARDIYFYHMASFLLVMALELTISSKTYNAFYVKLNPLPLESPIRSLGLAAAFLLQPPFLDILPMYCLFLLVTSFSINWFIKSRGYWVLSGSFILWVLATTTFWDKVGNFCTQYLPCNLGFFNPFAWQFLFLGGLFFGFRAAAGYRFPLNKSLTIISLIIWISILLIRYEVLPSNIFGFDVPSLTSRKSLGPLRVINSIVLAYLVTGVGIRFKKLLEWNWFSYLGQHSLQVFTFQTILLYSLKPLSNSIKTLYNLLNPYGWILFILASIVILSSLTLPAWVHVRYRAWKNQKVSAVENKP